MEAPEKIYLTKNLFGELRDGWDALPSDVFISVESTLALMPCARLDTSNDGHYRAFWHEMYSEWYSNPIDACTELLNREHSAQLHSCRQCAFCDWHNQYCRAKDADMGKAYMMAQKQCSYFEERKEEEE